MRARYFSAIERAVYLPDFMASCKSAMVISSNSNAAISSGRPSTERSSASVLIGLTAVTAAAATPPIKLARKNLRRAGLVGVCALARILFASGSLSYPLFRIAFRILLHREVSARCRSGKLCRPIVSQTDLQRHVFERYLQAGSAAIVTILSRCWTSACSWK